MRFSVAIKDVNNVFYKSCKKNGQAMGMAVPLLLCESGLFKIEYEEDGALSLRDHKGKSYKTHHGKTDKYCVAPSHMRGKGREYLKHVSDVYVCSYDYHLFTKLVNDSIEVVVLSKAETYSRIEGEGIVSVQ